MKEYLIKRLTRAGNGNQERNAIVITGINDSKEEHVRLAYNAAMANATDKKIIYLLGGNNPARCPFN